ncbi:hypothetical protein BH10PAT1_BH10PAT1_3760 [soil metagenome]
MEILRSISIQPDGNEVEWPILIPAGALEPLSKRAFAVLSCFETARMNNQPSPTVREICERVNIPSTSNVNHIINKLIKCSYLNDWSQNKPGSSRSATINVIMETVQITSKK